MAVIFTEAFEPDKEKVMVIHYGHELLSTEDLQKGIQVYSIPMPENVPQKDSVLFYIPSTGELIYEYIERPLTPEEELEQMKEKQTLMQQAIDDLILGGAL